MEESQVSSETTKPDLAKVDSLEAEIDFEAKAPRMAAFFEDYSISDATTLDSDLKKTRALCKQQSLDEFAAMDLQWKLEEEEKEAKLKKEMDEKALERLEVAALIKKAEEKLLPTENPEDISDASCIPQYEEILPELVTLDKVLTAADLIRMESSDMSSEEGFRLRLSCIMEESESDASGSGVVTKNSKKRLAAMEQAKIAENAKKLDGNGLAEVQEIAKSALLVENDLESAESPSLDSGQNEEATPTGQNEEVGPTGQNVARPTAQNEEARPTSQNEEARPTGENVEARPTGQNEEARPTGLDDSVESNSPEPNFGIRRLQSGTHVDKLQTRPNLIKRLESDSDSSLDLSIATGSPGVEEKSLEIYPKITFSHDKPPEEARSSSNTSLNVITSLSKAPTPENCTVDLESAEETPVKVTSGCDIVEITDEEVEAMFPKVGKIKPSKQEDIEVEEEEVPDVPNKESPPRKEQKKRRGQSLESDRRSEDSKSVSSCHVLSSQPRRLQAIFAKLRKSGRGRSLESGMSEKEAEKKKIEQNKSKTETSSQKGASMEEKPDVPPETYIWEELRRWREKGGYPWTHLDKPPFDEKSWKHKMDHEYEPVNPPPLESITKPKDDESPRRFIRIPRDEELVVSSVSAEDMEVEAIAAARELQDDLEDRFLATPLTTTTASRTDCDVNTSMLDSSGLEDLPLKRDSRSKKALQSKTEQMRAQAQGIQQRIRSQAGKLRQKLRSIPRPSFQRKQERPKQEGEEKPKFKFPERPKFSLPDKSKFKLPQKPKLSLPNFAKPLRERQADGKKMFDIDFKTYPRMFNKKSRDRGDYATSSPKLPRSATPPPGPIQPARKKGPVGQRWVNRFDDIKFVDDRQSEMSHPSNRSDISESLSGFHDRDFAMTEDLEHSHLPPPRALSTKSSISHLSDREIQSSGSSEDMRRKGVIEEIDSDQFFLRQKGISEDDINVGNYLSKEIKEAFKSPVVSALRQMDLDYEETEKELVREEPLPPTRMRSLKRTQKVSSREDPIEEPKPRYSNVEEKPTRYENVDDNASEYYKSPPSGQEIEQENYVSEHYKTPPPPQEYQHYKVPRSSKRKQTPVAEQSPSSKKQNGWVEVEIETELEEVPVEEPPQPLQRRKSKKSLKASQSVEAPEPEYIIPGEEEEEPPEAPKRTRSLSRGARSIHSLAKEIEKKTPIPPKRTSSRSINSLGLSQESAKVDSRSVHSLAFEEGKSATLPAKRARSKNTRSFQSLTQDDSQTPQPPERVRPLSRASHTSRSYHSINGDVPQPPERTRSLSRAKSKTSLPPEPIIKQVNHYEAQADDPYSGYAVVEKIKPPRPPPPRRQKGSPFNTFPRRSPVRPVRNYATLGPSRPPRKTRPRIAKSEEHIYTSDQMSQSYAEIDSAQPSQIEDLHLQATDVVEKMKIRPLPAPPRPPRIKARSEEQNQSMEEVEEVCVYTQTDPLPDDICLEDDIIQEFSHEQLKVQEEFLKEMREEEERIQREIEAKRARHLDVTAESEQNEAKLEIIRQMDDIIQEERRLLDRERHDHDDAQVDKKTAQLEVQVEDDMGYASLDRRLTAAEEELQDEAAAAPVRPGRSTTQRNSLVQEKKVPILDTSPAQISKEPPALESSATSYSQPSTSQEPLLTEIQSQIVSSSPIVQSISQQQPEHSPSVAQQQSGHSPSVAQQQPGPPSVVPQPSGHSPSVAQQQPEPPSVAQQQPGHSVIQSLVPIAQPDPIYIPLVPEILTTERLRVGQLEVDRLTVNELAARHLTIDELTTRDFHTQEVRGNSLQIQNISSQAGQLALDRVDLPPEFIQQIIAQIPWDELRPRLPVVEQEPAQTLQRKENEGIATTQQQVLSVRRRHRTLKQRSRSKSSDEELAQRQISPRRHPRAVVVAESRTEPSAGELGLQLARVCTSAGLQAVRDLRERIRPAEDENRSRMVQAVLCVLMVAIAGYLLLALGGKDVHHHHWDFQFPPQPPKP